MSIFLSNEKWEPPKTGGIQELVCQLISDDDRSKGDHAWRRGGGDRHKRILRLVKYHPKARSPDKALLLPPMRRPELAYQA
jgi:hypothetical protein